jgi:hypothetical protein
MARSSAEMESSGRYENRIYERGEEAQVLDMR